MCCACTDVDNLESIDSLEAYVEASTTLLVLLGSPRYFSSVNCLRELKQARRRRKPLCLVHEADPDKNGAALSDLEAACPPDLFSFVFELPDTKARDLKRHATRRSLLDRQASRKAKPTDSVGSATGPLFSRRPSGGGSRRLSWAGSRRQSGGSESGCGAPSTEPIASEWPKATGKIQAAFKRSLLQLHGTPKRGRAKRQLSSSALLSLGGRGECPSERRSTQESAERRPVLHWLRLFDFQCVTLKAVAEALLLKTPAYSSRAFLPLVIPGEVTRTSYAFDTPVKIFAAAVNPGAAAVAAELRASHPDVEWTDEAVELQAGQAQAVQVTHFLLYLTERCSHSPSSPVPCSSPLATRLGPSHPDHCLPPAIPPGPQHAPDRHDNGHRARAAHTHSHNQPPFFRSHPPPSSLHSTWASHPDALSSLVRSALAAGLPILLVHEKCADVGAIPFANLIDATPRDLISAGLYGTIAVPLYAAEYRDVSLKLALKALGAKPDRVSWAPCRSVLRLASRARRPRLLQLRSAKSKQTLPAFREVLPSFHPNKLGGDGCEMTGAL